MKEWIILSGFFESVIGFNEIGLFIVLKWSEKRRDDIWEVRVVIVLIDESIEVVEEDESVGEREKEVGVGREREERFERDAVLVWNGVGETVEVFGDSSVSFTHAQVRHCWCYVPRKKTSTTKWAPQSSRFSPSYKLNNHISHLNFISFIFIF